MKTNENKPTKKTITNNTKTNKKKKKPNKHKQSNKQTNKIKKQKQINYNKLYEYGVSIKLHYYCTMKMLNHAYMHDCRAIVNNVTL